MIVTVYFFFIGLMIGLMIGLVMGTEVARRNYKPLIKELKESGDYWYNQYTQLSNEWYEHIREEMRKTMEKLK